MFFFDFYIVMWFVFCNFCYEVINIICKGYWFLLNFLIYYKIYLYGVDERIGLILFWLIRFVIVKLVEYYFLIKVGKLVIVILSDLMWLLDYLVWYYVKRMIIVCNDNLYLKNDNYLECNFNMYGYVMDIYLIKVYKIGFVKWYN